MDICLNKKLLKKQNIDDATEKQILSTHEELYEIKQNPEKYDNVLELVTELEYRLQALWGFPQDSKYHTHQFEIKTCICPWMDNLERAGSGMFIYNTECPIHSKLKIKEYKMKKLLLPLVMLAGVSCQPSYAEEMTQTQMLERICVMESETAAEVMDLRQLGVPIGKTLAISEEPSYKVIVYAAYSMERYNTKQYQEASVREFSNAAFFHCLERHKE